jgi:sec-independent protein translocase protein TatA
MEGLSPLHLIIVLVIAVLVLGPGKLPEVGTALGKSIREFRKATTDMQDSVRLDTPPAALPAPVPAPSAAAVPPVAAEPTVVEPAPPVTCGVTRLSASERQSRAAAAAVCLATSQATASGLSGPPRRVGNSGSSGPPRRSRSHSRRTATVSLVSGVHRCFRPLPSQRTWGPAVRTTSETRTPTSSETRRPVWMARSRRATPTS